MKWFTIHPAKCWKLYCHFLLNIQITEGNYFAIYFTNSHDLKDVISDRYYKVWSLWKLEAVFVKMHLDFNAVDVGAHSKPNQNNVV